MLADAMFPSYSSRMSLTSSFPPLNTSDISSAILIRIAIDLTPILLSSPDACVGATAKDGEQPNGNSGDELGSEVRRRTYSQAKSPRILPEFSDSRPNLRYKVRSPFFVYTFFTHLY